LIWKYSPSSSSKPTYPSLSSSRTADTRPEVEGLFKRLAAQLAPSLSIVEKTPAEAGRSSSTHHRCAASVLTWLADLMGV
jgi:hypothetical protein